jgi:hypothetical protein
LKGAIERYSKTHFTKNNCTPGVTKGPGKAVRSIRTCHNVAKRNFMDGREHGYNFKRGC